MSGGFLVREARLRAGLSEGELAGRLGVGEGVVRAWECFEVEPSMEEVGRAARACGLDLQVSLVPYDDHDITLALRNLALMPEQRVQRLLDMLEFQEMAHRAVRVETGG